MRWIDLDTDRRELAIARQVVHTDHGLFPCPPKSASSQRGIALDLDTLRLLHHQERAQRGELGHDWPPSAAMFTRENGEAIDPNYLSYRFHKLVLASGLPPVRLHDLRHGAATLALAAGADLRVVQGLLRACQHRPHRRHLHLGAAAAVSRQRPGHRPAGPPSGSQDGAEGQQRSPWYVTHMCLTVTHDRTTRLQNHGKPQVGVVGRPGLEPGTYGLKVRSIYAGPCFNVFNCIALPDFVAFKMSENVSQCSLVSMAEEHATSMRRRVRRVMAYS
ncbi:tyrosine-type recombinase/integrase [Nonomuraea sp. K271]|nr:tyrosine-type recombinase/integrase [Nonomuraea sp. K271]